MSTCHKCRKPNPPDAAFCGFCGARITQPAPAQAPAGAKTVFGYTADAALAGGPAAVAPTVQVAQPAPPAASESTIPLTEQDLKGGQSLVGGRFLQAELIKRLPAGELFQARDVKQAGQAELLIVDAAVFPSPLDMERARRELRQLQKVECPALVKVLDHGKADDGRLFIALEAVPGTSLDELVARGPMDLAQAQRIIREVGTALAEAQKMGVIHRDIAPPNILLGAGGAVKVRGFAIAPPIKKHVFGTAEFISPEQASGRPVDQRSNIYSLGALMFYMLTGEPPFQAKSADEQLQKHQSEEAVSPRVRRPDLALSPRADALILKALSKSSSRRHLTLRQFLREVEALTDAAPAAASAPAQPLSFVTPLHGVTALTGGRRPPSSEATPGFDAAATISDERPVTAPPDSMEAGADVATLKTTIDASPSPALLATMAQAEPAPQPLTQPKVRPAAITGEMSSEVSLRPAPLAPARPEPASKPGPALTAAPASAQSAPAGKPGFRETMWFFKGEVESAMAETGSDGAPGPAAAEATPQELTAKYADDGSLSDEAARRLSLRTGKTQMMQNVKVPAGPLPGEKMAAEDFIHEMNRGRKIAIWGGLALVLAVMATLVIWLVVK